MAARIAGRARKRLTRRDLKEDKLIAMAQKVELFYERNRKAVFGGLVVILAVVIAAFVIRANWQKGFEEGSLNLTLAKVMFEMGRPDDGEAQLRELKAKYGGRIGGEAQYYLARSAFMRGDVEEAQAAFQEYLDKYHTDKYLDVAAIAGLAACLESQHNFTEAAETYLSVPRKYRKHHFSPQAMFQAARCYLWAGQRDRAIQTYQLLQRQYPSSTLKSKASRAVGLLQ